jgi:hypothetical protein
MGASALVARPWQLRWGATAEETRTTLPGDDLVPDAAYVITRAIAMQALAGAIWPWLVQPGQGRAGFSTYERLGQIVGAAIRSAARIVPKLRQIDGGRYWQSLAVGGPKVALLDPDRALVLYETMDLRTGQSIPSVPPTEWAMDWTWAFTLRLAGDGATQLLIRTRGNYRPHGLLAPAMALLLEPLHFVMERGHAAGHQAARRACGRRSRNRRAPAASHG